MSDFPKGPWKVETTSPEEGYEYWRITCGEGGPCNEVATIHALTTDEEAKRRAHLIAAAPDMAEALDWILNDPKIQTGIGGNPNYVEEGIARARAALAKARGES